MKKLFEKAFERLECSAQLTSSGVDGFDSIVLYYKDGRIAQLTCGLYGRSDRKGIFWGEMRNR